MRTHRWLADTWAIRLLKALMRLHMPATVRPATVSARRQEPDAGNDHAFAEAELAFPEALVEQALELELVLLLALQP